MRPFFVIHSIHKPFHGSFEVHKNSGSNGSVVLTCIGYNPTNWQTSIVYTKIYKKIKEFDRTCSAILCVFDVVIKEIDLPEARKIDLLIDMGL